LKAEYDEKIGKKIPEQQSIIQLADPNSYETMKGTASYKIQF
jgi:hypothetical protein